MEPESESSKLGREYGEFWAQESDEETVDFLDGVDWALEEQAGAEAWDTVRQALGSLLVPENATDDTDMNDWAEGFLKGVADYRHALEEKKYRDAEEESWAEAAVRKVFLGNQVPRTGIDERVFELKNDAVAADARSVIEGLLQDEETRRQSLERKATVTQTGLGLALTVGVGVVRIPAYHPFGGWLVRVAALLVVLLIASMAFSYLTVRVTSWTQPSEDDLFGEFSNVDAADYWFKKNGETPDGEGYWNRWMVRIRWRDYLRSLNKNSDKAHWLWWAQGSYLAAAALALVFAVLLLLGHGERFEAATEAASETDSQPGTEGRQRPTSTASTAAASTAEPARWITGKEVGGQEVEESR